jgi:hypothetical protein
VYCWIIIIIITQDCAKIAKSFLVASRHHHSSNFQTV